MQLCSNNPGPGASNGAWSLSEMTTFVEIAASVCLVWSCAVFVVQFVGIRAMYASEYWFSCSRSLLTRWHPALYHTPASLWRPYPQPDETMRPP